MTKDDLYFIRNKGNCIRTVDRAFQKLQSIKTDLTTVTYNALHVALSHVKSGEGAAELNDIISKLSKSI